MQWVHRKQCGNKRAAPECSRERAEPEEKQDRVARVKQQVGQVMTRRTQSVKLAIQHVREPRQRVPIRAMNVSEGPLQPRPSQSRRNLRIAGDVIVVIEGEKVQIDDRQIDRHGSQ